MGDEKLTVVTVHGHNKEVDKIAISVFSTSEAEYYCDTINNLKLEGEQWVYTKIISLNTPYSMEEFLPVKFDVILNFDSKVIQKILREIDSQDLVKALKGESEEIRQKIFSNVSQRAVEMLKDDEECLGPVHRNDVINAQNKILNIIKRMEAAGELVIPYSKGELEK